MLTWFRRLRSKAGPAPVRSKAEATAAEEAAKPLGTSVTISSKFAFEHSGDATDYLSIPSVAAYFDARESETYYQALKRVGPQRDFHERLVATLERFIDLTNSPSGAAAIDRVIAESLRMEQSGRGPASAAPIEVARSKYPKGIELLRLAEPLTYCLGSA